MAKHRAVEPNKFSFVSSASVLIGGLLIGAGIFTSSSVNGPSNNVPNANGPTEQPVEETPGGNDNNSVDANESGVIDVGLRAAEDVIRTNPPEVRRNAPIERPDSPVVPPKPPTQPIPPQKRSSDVEANLDVDGPGIDAHADAEVTLLSDLVGGTCQVTGALKIPVC